MDAAARAAWLAGGAAPAPQVMARAALLARLREQRPWDAVIVGGGATGLGIAVDAAARGLRVALIDAQDFGAGTSSRSTKLLHGGVRYLAQGNVKLVREALAERAVLLRNAPSLVRPLEFVVPCYRPLERVFLRIGLGLYDTLAGPASLGPTRWLSRAETLARLPGITARGLHGGIAYWDAQFNDALMCIALMQTAFALGATPINYVRCTGLDVDDAGRVTAVRAEDAETGETLRLATRCVFNAAGVWVDRMRQMALPQCAPVIRVSQGSHVVVDRAVMPAEAALLIPRTRDGRVLFAVPWLGRVLIGTTDEPRTDAPFDPEPAAGEIDFLLATANQVLDQRLTRADVRASFTGLRPLYSMRGAGSTAQVSREHAVLTEAGGLISVVGGKWTTYRRMAADALRAAARAGVCPTDVVDTSRLRLVEDRELLAAARRVEQGDEGGWPGLLEAAMQRSQAQGRVDAVARRARVAQLDRATEQVVSSD
jgi:glycerol-3-phosphate dehydrogenase